MPIWSDRKLRILFCVAAGFEETEIDLDRIRQLPTGEFEVLFEQAQREREEGSEDEDEDDEESEEEEGERDEKAPRPPKETAAEQDVKEERNSSSSSRDLSSEPPSRMPQGQKQTQAGKQGEKQKERETSHKETVSFQVPDEDEGAKLGSSSKSPQNRQRHSVVARAAAPLSLEFLNQNSPSRTSLSDSKAPTQGLHASSTGRFRRLSVSTAGPGGGLDQSGARAVGSSSPRKSVVLLQKTRGFSQTGPGGVSEASTPAVVATTSYERVATAFESLFGDQKDVVMTLRRHEDRLEEAAFHAERTKTRLSLWKDSLTANAHVIDAVAATVSSLQHELQKLALRVPNLTDIESVLQAQRMEAQDELSRFSDRIALLKSNAEKAEQLKTEVMRVLGLEVGKIAATVNTVCLREEQDRESIGELRNEVNKATEALEEVSVKENARVLREETLRRETDGLKELAQKVTKILDCRHLELEAEVNKQVEAATEPISERAKGTANRLEMLLTAVVAESKKGSHTAKTLDQLRAEVSDLIRLRLLPEKTREARLFALETMFKASEDERLRHAEGLGNLASLAEAAMREACLASLSAAKSSSSKGGDGGGTREKSQSQGQAGCVDSQESGGTSNENSGEAKNLHFSVALPDYKSLALDSSDFHRERERTQGAFLSVHMEKVEVGPEAGGSKEHEKGVNHPPSLSITPSIPPSTASLHRGTGTGPRSTPYTANSPLHTPRGGGARGMSKTPVWSRRPSQTAYEQMGKAGILSGIGDGAGPSITQLTGVSEGENAHLIAQPRLRVSPASSMRLLGEEQRLGRGKDGVSKRKRSEDRERRKTEEAQQQGERAPCQATPTNVPTNPEGMHPQPPPLNPNAFPPSSFPRCSRLSPRPSPAEAFTSDPPQISVLPLVKQTPLGLPGTPRRETTYSGERGEIKSRQKSAMTDFVPTRPQTRRAPESRGGGGPSAVTPRLAETPGEPGGVHAAKWGLMGPWGGDAQLAWDHAGGRVGGFPVTEAPGATDSSAGGLSVAERRRHEALRVGRERLGKAREEAARVAGGQKGSGVVGKQAGKERELPASTAETSPSEQRRSLKKQPVKMETHLREGISDVVANLYDLEEAGPLGTPRAAAVTARAQTVGAGVVRPRKVLQESAAASGGKPGFGSLDSTGPSQQAYSSSLKPGSGSGSRTSGPNSKRGSLV
uniref:Uncharacterized protein n=1 Tax=Chromera velia CCMP2878 TaxID=1169474 RepID=A0A0G4I338_9ALVE|eukprot:Cvel_1740.t1-p1 / transcript=Cvel_1740.t1 / gene=Cvel_1740 / organism=Chromera_velia_CCMP2878 / gene_product=hypothetical protein / transcript_product=hypothetical protein / location=Cvel_scaffold63:74826-82277(-) / protein_length=1188 / sequence_SO=supercontig / SO=protein_coding / is_pseudo=false